MGRIIINNESGDRKYFTIIPNFILNHSTMWDREAYVQMKRIAGENSTCYASRSTLAKQCGMSPRRLDASLKYLIENKWIKFIGLKEVITRGGAQYVKEYEISDLWKMNIDYYENLKGVAPNTPPKRKGVAPNAKRGSMVISKGVAHGAHKEEPREEELREEDKSTAIAENKEARKLFDLFKEVRPSYEILFKRKHEWAAARRLLSKIPLEKLEPMVKMLPKINTMQYAPVITSPSELEDKLEKLRAFIIKENQKSSINKIISVR